MNCNLLLLSNARNLTVDFFQNRMSVKDRLSWSRLAKKLAIVGKLKSVKSIIPGAFRTVY